MIVPISTGGELLACFDGSTNSACAGSWPIDAPAGYSQSYGAAFPTLNAGGATTGLCLPASAIPCFTLAGAPVATPSGLTGVIWAGTPWNGPALTLGPRIYVPNGNGDIVQCFDFSTGVSWANFPKSLPGLSYAPCLQAAKVQPHRGLRIECRR